MADNGTKDEAPAVTREDVRRICGDIADHKVVSILESGARIDELEEAVAWVAAGEDISGEHRLPVSGKAEQLCGILLADEDYDEER